MKRYRGMPTTESVVEGGDLSSTRTFQVQFILEDNASDHWAIDDLSHWVSPDMTGVSMVQAMSDVMESQWLDQEDDLNPGLFWESAADRRQALRAQQYNDKKRLQVHGFEVLGTQLTTITNQGARHILANMEHAPKDLLVVVPEKAQQDDEHTSSFSSWLATHAPCPVLMLKRPIQDSSKPAKVLLSVDDCDASRRAIAQLSSVLNPANMEVTLVTVLNTVYANDALLPHYINTDAIYEALKENGDTALTNAAKTLQENGVNVVAQHCVTGTPAWEIMTLSESLSPDLVVVGSHNRTGVNAWLLGSVSARVVQSLSTSVLIIR